MSTSSIQVTSFPDSIGTKILCFGCDVPCEIQDHTALTLNDEHEDFDDPLTNQKLGNHQVMPPPTLDIGMLENVGIVGTVTFLGRSTAMVWVGWGRLLPKYHQDVDGDTTQQNLGAGMLKQIVIRCCCLHESVLNSGLVCFHIAPSFKSANGSINGVDATENVPRCFCIGTSIIEID